MHHFSPPPSARGVPTPRRTSGAICTPSVAIEAIPLGWFHYRIFAVLSLLFLGTGWVMDCVIFTYTDLVSHFNVSFKELGFLFGAPMFGVLFGGCASVFADRLGRRDVLVVFTLISLTATVAQYWAATFSSLMMLRGAIGFGTGGIHALASTYMAEFLPTHSRGMLLNTMGACYPLGVFCSLLTWTASQSYRTSLLCSGLPLLLFLPVALFLPESPRYLSVRGRDLEAWQVIASMHRANVGPDLPASIQLGLMQGTAAATRSQERQLEEQNPQDEEEHHPVVHAINVSDMPAPGFKALISSYGRVFGILGVAWILLGMGTATMHFAMPYYLDAVSTTGRRYFDAAKTGPHEWPLGALFVLSASDSLCQVLGALYMDRIGRRLVLIIGFAAAGSGCFLSLIFVNEAWVTAIGAFQQGGQAMVWLSIAVLATESFPTSCRTSAVGALRSIEGSGIAIGAIVAAEVVGSSKSLGLVLAVCMAGGCYLLGFLVCTFWLQPEDDQVNRPLEDLPEKAAAAALRAAEKKMLLPGKGQLKNPSSAMAYSVLGARVAGRLGMTSIGRRSQDCDEENKC